MEFAQVWTGPIRFPQFHGSNIWKEYTKKKHHDLRTTGSTSMFCWLCYFMLFDVISQLTRFRSHVVIDCILLFRPLMPVCIQIIHDNGPPPSSQRFIHQNFMWKPWISCGTHSSNPMKTLMKWESHHQQKHTFCSCNPMKTAPQVPMPPLPWEIPTLSTPSTHPGCAEESEGPVARKASKGTVLASNMGIPKMGWPFLSYNGWFIRGFKLQFHGI